MNNDTLLLRQVHPSWVIGDIISQQTFSSQTFRPTSKDSGLLSVYSGEHFTANTAFEHYTSNFNLQSAGIVAVTPKECSSISVPILEDNQPFVGHCSIDYRELNASEIKRSASILKRYAHLRGWLYQAMS